MEKINHAVLAKFEPNPFQFGRFLSFLRKKILWTSPKLKSSFQLLRLHAQTFEANEKIVKKSFDKI